MIIVVSSFFCLPFCDVILFLLCTVTSSPGINSLGTPPINTINTINRLTFQARLLHNQEGANAEKDGYRKISSRAFFRRTGRCSNPLGYGAIEP